MATYQKDQPSTTSAHPKTQANIDIGGKDRAVILSAILTLKGISYMVIPMRDEFTRFTVYKNDEPTVVDLISCCL